MLVSCRGGRITEPEGDLGEVSLGPGKERFVPRGMVLVPLRFKRREGSAQVSKGGPRKTQQIPHPRLRSGGEFLAKRCFRYRCGGPCLVAAHRDFTGRPGEPAIIPLGATGARVHAAGFVEGQSRRSNVADSKVEMGERGEEGNAGWRFRPYFGSEPLQFGDSRTVPLDRIEVAPDHARELLGGLRIDRCNEGNDRSEIVEFDMNITDPCPVRSAPRTQRFQIPGTENLAFAWRKPGRRTRRSAGGRLKFQFHDRMMTDPSARY